MIIIKSQDGESIRKYNGVNVDPNDRGVINGTVLEPFNFNETVAYYELGEYESEERAKEVMDEIEEHMRNTKCNEDGLSISHIIFDDVDKDRKEELLKEIYKTSSKLSIYTMPKE